MPPCPDPKPKTLFPYRVKVRITKDRLYDVEAETLKKAIEAALDVSADDSSSYIELASGGVEVIQVKLVE